MSRQVGITRAAAALVLLAACSSGGNGGTPQHFGVPTSYHITYAVSSSGARWTEDLWVNRPFDSDDWSHRADEEISRVTAALGRQVVQAQAAAQGVLQVPPNPAPGDVRLDAVAATAIARGQLVARAQRTIAGRRCRVYRSAQPLAARTIVAKPTEENHVDTCVDREGLVLEERAGAVHKRAVKVEFAGAHDFAVDGTEVPLDQGGGRITPLTDDSRPPGESFFELASPPKGFTHQGRYAVVPPQPRVIGSLATSVDDVFVRGADVIVVSNGHRAAAAEPGGTTVGELQLYVSAAGSRVAKTSAHGAYVEVRGTVSPAALLNLAKSLVRKSPGTLVTR
jgi:hypothetical protein